MLNRAYQIEVFNNLSAGAIFKTIYLKLYLKLTLLLSEPGLESEII